MRRRFIINRNRIPFTVDNYLTIEALEDGLTVNFPSEIECGIDGMGWFTLPPSTNSPQINTGHTISFRARFIPFELEGVGTFVISKKCKIIGNCMSLLFGDYANENFNLIGYEYAFSRLFKDCNTIISVNENILPATSISSSCYYGMFYGCTSLVNAPKLPATTLYYQCYYGMFYGCTSLVNAPELPATTLALYCYSNMFRGCTSLVNAPELPATTLASYCYSNMFRGCTKLNYIKMLATDISGSGCLDNWVYNVSSTGIFIKSKDATWDVEGSDGIPYGWTVITE